MATRLMAEAAERFARGDEEVAAHLNAQVLALDSGCSQAFALRGFIHSEKGRYKEVMLDFDHAITLSPQNSLAIYRRAIAKHCLDDLDGAIADYDLAMTLEPACADAQPGARRR